MRIDMVALPTITWWRQRREEKKRRHNLRRLRRQQQLRIPIRGRYQNRRSSGKRVRNCLVPILRIFEVNYKRTRIHQNMHRLRFNRKRFHQIRLLGYRFLDRAPGNREKIFVGVRQRFTKIALVHDVPFSDVGKRVLAVSSRAGV